MRTPIHPPALARCAGFARYGPRGARPRIDNVWITRPR